MTETTSPQSHRWARAATMASVCVAIILIVAKAYVWGRTGSAAVLGSLADSVLDGVASAIAFIGVRMASQPPDENHRFGHEKAEAICSLVQLILISGSAVFVMTESCRHLFAPEPLQHANEALGVMGLSLVLTMALVSFQTFALRQTSSLATESDRAHYVGDVIANGGALIAILLASRFDVLWADGLAGVAAAFFLGWSAISIARRTLPQLMDAELSDEDRQRIASAVRLDPNVLGLHALRTRSAGHRLHIQFHLELDPRLSLLDAHEISDAAEARIRASYPHADIIIHQDIHGEAEAHGPFGQPCTA